MSHIKEGQTQRKQVHEIGFIKLENIVLSKNVIVLNRRSCTETHETTATQVFFCVTVFFFVLNWRSYTKSHETIIALLLFYVTVLFYLEVVHKLLFYVTVLLF
jgi:hypothetical protein